MTGTTGRLLTAREVADQLNVIIATVLRWAQCGDRCERATALRWGHA
jgi:hypothetical protein